MKKGILAASAAIAALLIACGPKEDPIEPPQPANVEVTSVTLNQATLTLETGQTGNLTATVQPSNATDKSITWSSSNTSVAIVYNGTVTAEGEGTATITATAGGKSASCQVTVSKKVVPVTAIEFIETDHSVYIGKSIQLSIKLTPSNATETPVLTSSDESIATVDENWKVTGVNLGKVTITAAVGDKEATYSVEVHNPLIESITIEPAEITVYQGDTVRFTASTDPEEVVIQHIDWDTGDPYVVRNTLDENYDVKNDGSFVAYGPGTTTVRVVINSYKSATAQVTVIEPDYMAKEKAALMAFYNAHKNHWSHHDNWGADGPVTSAWEGVEMDPTGTHVKGLQIWDGLGKIPKEIEDLTELEYLSFNCNLELSYGLPKSTFGPLPKEIGNLKKLKRIVMYDYPLTGKLPESLFTLSNLETLYIVRSQYMDNAPLSSSIGQLTNLEQLDLNTNNFSGSLPKEIGNLTKLTWLNLSYNSFTGTIPASYSGLRNLENFDLMGNGLSGTLPASLAKIERFPLIWGRAVQFNNFTQEDVRKSKIPAPTSPPVKTVSGKELDIEAFIKGNKYTVLFDVAADYPEVAEYLASLENLYKKGKSKGLGVLTFFDNNSNKEPDLSRRDQLFKDLLKKSGAEWESFIRHMYDDIPTEKAPFYAIKGDGMYPYGSINQIVIIGPDGTVDYTTLVDSDQKKNVENALKYLEKALNVSMTHYESKSYSRDGNYKTLQKASTGKGIDLVITGDAFSDRDITGGTFEKAAKQAMNDLFMVEPLKSMKNRFNVYMVEAVSKNDEYFSGCSTVFSGVFGSGSAVGGDNKKVLEYAKKVIKTDDKMDNVMVLVLMNSYRDAGTTYMMDPADESIYAGGASVIWIPYKDVTVTGGYSNMATTIIHEVGGHGLGKLADEYSYLSLGEVTSSEVTKINKYHKWNRFTNISLTSNPNQVLWKQFIGDSAFASENIGVYEGGDAFWSGVWRPTEQSVMNDSYNHSTFNAPSRSQLYTRIMKLSEGSSWKYDYNTFKTWDKAHPTKVATRSIVETDKEEHVHIPPVLLGKTWKEVIDGR